MNRVVLHIDVNNAFLSWTAVDLLKKGNKYDIRNSYTVIGGDETKRRGIVLAKSTPCKKIGITTGETLYSARKKCPNLNIYPPNYSLYEQMSKELFNLLFNYTDDIEIFSIDECFLDYTKIKKLHKNELDFAYKIKEEIKQKLGFTVNIGIGNNKLCAKMASDFEKPDKVHTLYQNEIKAKMYPLSIGDLFGIGKKTTEKLKRLNIYTIKDLAEADVNMLHFYFKNQAFKMIELANGIDDSPVVKERTKQVSISNSTTLEHDVDNKIEIYKVLEQLSDNVSLALRKKKKYAYVVAVQLKDCYFNSEIHQKKLENATNLTSEIFKTAKELVNEMWNDKKIRLVGIKLDNLVDISNHQVSLFESIEKNDNNVKLEETLDKLKDKFGNKIINNASLLNKKISKKNLK